MLNNLKFAVMPKFPKDQPLTWYERCLNVVEIPNTSEELKRITARLLRFRERYELIESCTEVPWELIAALHYLKYRTNFLDSFFGGRLRGEGEWVWDTTSYFKLYLGKNWTDAQVLKVAEKELGMSDYNCKSFSSDVWGGTSLCSKSTFGAYVIFVSLKFRSFGN